MRKEVLLGALSSIACAAAGIVFTQVSLHYGKDYLSFASEDPTLETIYGGLIGFGAGLALSGIGCMINKLCSTPSESPYFEDESDSESVIDGKARAHLREIRVLCEQYHKFPFYGSTSDGAVEQVDLTVSIQIRR